RTTKGCVASRVAVAEMPLAIADVVRVAALRRPPAADVVPDSQTQVPADAKLGPLCSVEPIMFEHDIHAEICFFEQRRRVHRELRIISIRKHHLLPDLQRISIRASRLYVDAFATPVR